MRSTILIALLGCLAVGVMAEQAEPADTPQAHQVGTYTVTFEERARQSARPQLQGRLFHERLTDKHPDYTLADERFHVVVPDGYNEQTPHGLLVWISPNAEATPRPDWIDELSKRKLIWVGAQNAGNDRAIWQRLGLPLDAVHNMRGRYTLDEDRIYIAGASGGGRSSSRLGVGMADVFDGALPIVGCDFYEQVEAPGQPGLYYRAFKKPNAPLLNHARKNLRLVILTGSEDENRDQCRLYFELYRAQKFEHAVYLEVPGMGHTYPDATWFGKGLDALDAPLLAKRSAPGTAPADTAEPATNASDHATPAPPRVTVSPQKARLELAKNYLSGGKQDLAARELRHILAHHPDTPEAAEAQRLLDSLPKQEDPDA